MQVRARALRLTTCVAGLCRLVGRQQRVATSELGTRGPPGRDGRDTGPAKARSKGEGWAGRRGRRLRAKPVGSAWRVLPAYTAQLKPTRTATPNAIFRPGGSARGCAMTFLFLSHVASRRKTSTIYTVQCKEPQRSIDPEDLDIPMPTYRRLDANPTGGLHTPSTRRSFSRSTSRARSVWSARAGHSRAHRRARRGSSRTCRSRTTSAPRRGCWCRSKCTRAARRCPRRPCWRSCARSGRTSITGASWECPAST
jgi:hypothetical protein